MDRTCVVVVVVVVVLIFACEPAPRASGPVVTAVVPNEIELGAPTLIEIQGEHLYVGVATDFRVPKGMRVDARFLGDLDGDPLQSLRWVNNNTLQATTSVGLPLGTHDLHITTPDGQFADLQNAINVVATATNCGDRTNPARACTTYFRDDDRDTYGLTGDSLCLCAPAAPYDATVGGDCNDDPTDCGIDCNTGVPAELCDGYDNNCDGQTDEGCDMVFGPTLDAANSGLVNDDVTAVTVDAAGNLWVGTAGSGSASYLPAGNTTFETITGLKSSPIRVVVVDGNGDAWIIYDETGCDGVCSSGYDCGPSQVSSLTRAVTSYCTEYMSTINNATTAAVMDPDTGDIYIGTTNDYAIYLASFGTLSCDIELPGPTVGDYCRAMIVDNENPRHIWVGTNMDLHECLPNHPSPSQCNDSCSIRDVFSGSDDDVSRMVFSNGGTPGRTTVERADDRLWIGSYVHGFARFDLATDSTTDVWDSTSGLPSDRVQAVAADSESQVVYVGTDAGLSRYTVATVAWLTFTAADGLPSSNVTALAIDTANRILWIGTDAGLTSSNLP